MINHFSDDGWTEAFVTVRRPTLTHVCAAGGLPRPLSRKDGLGKVSAGRGGNNVDTAWGEWRGGRCERRMLVV